MRDDDDDGGVEISSALNEQDTNKGNEFPAFVDKDVNLHDSPMPNKEHQVISGTKPFVSDHLPNVTPTVKSPTAASMKKYAFECSRQPK